ncbi:S8 family peptidase [bacterium]|nr:S8 family peptidase [bacterium]
MKRLLLCVAAAAMLLGACERAPENLVQEDDYIKTSLEVIPGQYVVLLKGDFGYVKSDLMSYDDSQIAMTGITKNILAKAGITGREPLNVYSSAIQGFAVNLSESEVATLENNPNVSGVWPDMLFTLAKPGTNPSDPPKQVTPYGITRVGGPTNYTGSAKAWIIDTGIDLDHPDLNVNTTLARTLVPRTSSAEDDNGHGTHCAGIVAAKNNTIGVVGVAAGATVVPVKVLDRRGSGAYSIIIAGVDYVAGAATSGDVANMSLGGGAYKPIDDAVIAMAKAGVRVSLAAGNESDDANNHSPARANGLNIYTISACDGADKWAYFSNYGNPPIDYCAPGMSILSTYKGGALATMSGTSMAAPHACGVLLLTGRVPDSDGFVSGDPDGNPDPIIFYQKN